MPTTSKSNDSLCGLISLYASAGLDYVVFVVFCGFIADLTGYSSKSVIF